MWKPLTGEPYAGKPHVRFGGRGGAEPSLPLSIQLGAPPAAQAALLAEVERWRADFYTAGGMFALLGAEMLSSQLPR